jgi:folate-dependent phosphoribosylglycinamide formyltransferase PurN
MVKNRFFSKKAQSRLPYCAIFMSGSGSNTCQLIESLRDSAEPTYEIKVLFTDRPKSSQTIAIGEKYGIPVVSVGLKQFYLERGLESTSLATEEGQAMRDLWTEEVLTVLKPYEIDFALLAGFEPLCNIMKHFPCLNIHPGDLTYEKNGERYLVGLHAIPIERAICEGLSTLRSSVILAEPFVGKGENMDSGYVLGISDEVEVDFMGYSLDELKACCNSRSSDSQEVADVLRTVAIHNQMLLKEQGDWIVFPRVVNDFARDRFLYDDTGQLYYATPYLVPISTVIYGSDFKELLFSIH